MGVLFGILCPLFFAVNNVALKIGMRTSAKDNGVYVTMIVNTLVLGSVLIVYRGLIAESPPSITLLGILIFAVAGLLTNLTGRILLFSGIRKIGPSRAVAIKNSAPVFTVLFAVVVLQEHIGLWPLIGICCVMLGLILQGYTFFQVRSQNATDPKKSAMGRVYQLGVMLSFLAAVAFGTGQGMRKQAMLFLEDPFFGAFIGVTSAFLIMTIIEWRKKSIRSAVSMLKNKYFIISGITTGLATLCFFIALWFIPVAYVAAMVALEPILTIILSRLFLKEEIVYRSIVVSAIVIFIGVGIIGFSA